MDLVTFLCSYNNINKFIIKNSSVRNTILMFLSFIFFTLNLSRKKNVGWQYLNKLLSLKLCKSGQVPLISEKTEHLSCYTVCSRTCVWRATVTPQFCWPSVCPLSSTVHILSSSLFIYYLKCWHYQGKIHSNYSPLQK